MQKSSKDYKEYRRMISILKTAKLSVPYCDEKQEKKKMNSYLFPKYIGKGTSRDKSKSCSVVWRLVYCMNGMMLF